MNFSVEWYAQNDRLDCPRVALPLVCFPCLRRAHIHFRIILSHRRSNDIFIEYI